MNQCDGCRAGWELRDGLHYDRHGKVQMTCTATRYPLNANAIKTLPNGDTEGFSMFITSMVPEQPAALVRAEVLEEAAGVVPLRRQQAPVSQRNAMAASGGRAPTPTEGQAMTCKTHPDAPHGFDRNASHSQDRYVCECESWEPPEQTKPMGVSCPRCGKPLYQDSIHTCSPQYDSEDATNDLIANSKLPPALALANHLERTMQWPLHGKAADELRRLHAENEALREALESVWLWMENQADGQSKGGHATFDLLMLREQRDIARAALARAGEVK